MDDVVAFLFARAAAASGNATASSSLQSARRGSQSTDSPAVVGGEGPDRWLQWQRGTFTA
jgi:hypothetical protein